MGGGIGKEDLHFAFFRLYSSSAGAEMKPSKSKEHRFDFNGMSGVVRKGVQFHMSAESWEYGRHHALPLWTEYVVYPAILPRGYCFSQENTTMTSFELVLEGSMTILLDETRLTVHPKEICLIPAGKSKHLEVREDCRKVVFGICGQLHLPLLAMTGLYSKILHRLNDPEQILAILRELHRLLKEKSEASTARIAGLTMELVTEIGKEAGRAPVPLLADAFRVLEFRLAEPFRLSALAEELHVTTDYLNRLFRKEVGIPPKHYLIEQRMHLALSLLNSTRLTVQEISLKCGYKTQFAFSREFRKRFGMSPSECRKESKDKKKI